MSKKIPIEVGIPAYNENANIKKLLQSIVSQKLETVDLKKILVISDGSDDDTVSKALEVQSSLIQVVDSRERLGKSARMCQLFRMAQTDIMVLLDADTILDGDNVIESIARPIVKSEATLTSGHPVKVSAISYADKVMDVSQDLQDYVKKHHRDGDSVYACHGRIVALHRSIFDKLELPFSSVGNDAYLYFFNLTNNGTFAYCEDAKVKFKMPQNLNDFSKQRTRFANSQSEQRSIFGSVVDQHYAVSNRIKIMAMIQALLRRHIYAITYVVWALWPSKTRKITSGQWEVSDSTKNI